MRTSIFLSVLSTAAVAVAIDAPETTNNLSASYFAVLPNRVDTKVRGTINIASAPNGKGADVSVVLSGFPAEGGPFLYHIHDQPVPADGNCTGAGAHLDPYGRGETPACDASAKQTCQVGDLSGKYGNITTTGFSIAYNDKFLSLVPGTPAYFGNRSIVIHYANKTRITCANFITISTGYETPVIPPGYSTATAASSGHPVNSANATTPPKFSSASPTSGSPTTGKPPSTTSPTGAIVGTGAANPAHWVSSGALLGAIGVVFAMAL